MTILEDVLREVRPEVPGCPAPTLRHAVVEAARRFCDDTGILRDTVSFSSVPDQTEYVVEAISPDNIAFAVYSVRRGQELLYPKGEQPSNRFERQSRPFYYTFARYKLQLYPTPIESEDFSVELYVKPKPSAETLDERLDRHFEAIGHWTKYRLLLMRTTPWYDVEAAMICRARYDALKNDARWADLRANTRAAIGVHQRPFA